MGDLPDGKKLISARRFVGVAQCILGAILGCLFWILVQKVSPAIQSVLIDEWVVPGVPAITAALAIHYLWPNLRLLAWSFAAGVFLFALMFTMFMGAGGSPVMTI